MLTESGVARLLGPFGISLSSAQSSQLLAYLELLLRWNRKINLTAVRGAEDCVTRHFGESLYLARWVELRGALLDIGSGAGFPGLALKIPFPELRVTLLEPVAKKRAFLKEVARVCGMESVEVRGERLEQFTAPALFDAVTARAVGQLDELVPRSARLLKPGGRLCLWITRQQAVRLAEFQVPIDWAAPVPLPLGRDREIWVGSLRPS